MSSEGVYLPGLIEMLSKFEVEMGPGDYETERSLTPLEFFLALAKEQPDKLDEIANLFYKLIESYKELQPNSLFNVVVDPLDVYSKNFSHIEKRLNTLLNPNARMLYEQATSTPLREDQLFLMFLEDVGVEDAQTYLELLGPTGLRDLLVTWHEAPHVDETILNSILYGAKKFKESNLPPQELLLRLYLALAYSAIDEVDKAEKILENIKSVNLSDEKRYFVDELEFYKGLTMSEILCFTINYLWLSQDPKLIVGLLPRSSELRTISTMENTYLEALGLNPKRVIKGVTKTYGQLIFSTERLIPVINTMRYPDFEPEKLKGYIDFVKHPTIIPFSITFKRDYIQGKGGHSHLRELGETDLLGFMKIVQIVELDKYDGKIKYKPALLVDESAGIGEGEEFKQVHIHFPYTTAHDNDLEKTVLQDPIPVLTFVRYVAEKIEVPYIILPANPANGYKKEIFVRDTPGIDDDLPIESEVYTVVGYVSKVVQNP